MSDQPAAPTSRPAGAWASRAQLLGAVAVAVVGCNLLTFTSLALLAVSLALVAAGVAWFARTLVVSGRRTGARWKTNLALVIVSSTVALLGLVPPAFTRVGSRLAPTSSQREDAELGWVHDAGDVVGQRMDTIDHARDHVLVVGDSITYGNGLRKEETAPYLLDGMLRPYQVLNLSISGYSIDQYWLYLRRVLPRTRAKLVVVAIYSGNDFEITSRDYGWGHSKPLFVEEGGRLVRKNPDLLADNCIDRVARSLLFSVVWRNHDVAQVLLDRLCGARQLELDEAERAIGLMFREIEATARAAGARTLFVLLPEQRNFVGHSGANFPTEMLYMTMYRQLAALLRAGGHDVFEFAGDIARSGVPFEQLFLDEGHYKPAGQELLARALRREIVSRSLLEPPPAAGTL